MHCFEDGWGLCQKERGQREGAARCPGLSANKEIETSVLQLQGTEISQQLE